MTESGQKEDATSFLCHDAIDICLAIEKEGVLYYEKAAREAKDPRAKTIFSWLAGEEKEHIHSLRGKGRFLQPVLNKRSTPNKSVGLYIETYVKNKVFPLRLKNDERISVEVKDIDAVEMGIESEKRSIEILDRLLHSEKKIDVRVIFSHLIVEEKKHLIALEALKEHLLARNP